LRRKRSTEREEIELDKNSKIERLNSGDSDSKSKSCKKRRDSRRLPEKSLSARESLVRSRRKPRDRGEEGTGRLKSKKD
jgi:hypothetical protein